MYNCTENGPFVLFLPILFPSNVSPNVALKLFLHFDEDSDNITQIFF